MCGSSDKWVARLVHAFHEVIMCEKVVLVSQLDKVISVHDWKFVHAIPKSGYNMMFFCERAITWGLNDFNIFVKEFVIFAEVTAYKFVS
jgi:hypothetical protein